MREWVLLVCLAVTIALWQWQVWRLRQELIAALRQAVKLGNAAATHEEFSACLMRQVIADAKGGGFSEQTEASDACFLDGYGQFFPKGGGERA